MFMLSGFSGILYQVIWLREAFNSFGVVTPILSVVISTFMLGLGLGSWFGGMLSRKWEQLTSCSALLLYAIIELCIAIGGIVVPNCFSMSEILLQNIEGASSPLFLFSSGSLIAISMLPWCFLMGLTYPVMLTFISQNGDVKRSGFSLLYFSNVLGSVFGAIIPAFILIELLGLRGTLLIGLYSNGLASLFAFFAYLKIKKIKIDRCFKSHYGSSIINKKLYFILFFTGFLSMGAEVVWIRAYSPILGTTIYSFAFLLAVYLLFTWFGSSIYRNGLKNRNVMSLDILLALGFLFFVLTLVLPDARIGGLDYFKFSSELFILGSRSTSLISILSLIISVGIFSLILGYLTPMIIDRLGGGDAETTGKVYAINIIGSVLGPLLMGYFVVPIFGVKASLILLSTIFLLVFLFVYRDTVPKPLITNAITVIGAIMLVMGVFFTVTFEEYLPDKTRHEIRRDHVATVIAKGEGRNKQLFVNGIGITIITTITKIMAHMPLLVHSGQPKSGLVICFGMGTTFRSMLSWGIETKAIELSKAVAESFGFFFSDYEEILSSSKAELIIDDGRRYLVRNERKYDVITIDPPPPIQAAGSGLLYSDEFIKLLRLRLNEDGILHHWFPGVKDTVVLPGIVRAITNNFEHTRIFMSGEKGGFHILSSRLPIVLPRTVGELAKRVPLAASADMLEWTAEDVTLPFLLYSIFRTEVSVEEILKANGDSLLTDDRPLNEYYLLRQLRTLYSGGSIE